MQIFQYYYVHITTIDNINKNIVLSDNILLFIDN